MRSTGTIVVHLFKHKTHTYICEGILFDMTDLQYFRQCDRAGSW